MSGRSPLDPRSESALALVLWAGIIAAGLTLGAVLGWLIHRRYT